MQRIRHGVLTLVWVGAACVLGLAAVFARQAAAGWIYLGLLVILPPAVIYAFCAKCPGRRACGHVLPGRIACALPSRPETPYGSGDLLIAAVALTVLVLFPQPWLWPNKILLTIFWALILLAVTEIRLRVCPGCSNRFCPGRLNR